MSDLRFFADPEDASRAPQFVDYEKQALKGAALEYVRNKPPMDAANGDGVPQVGPPFVPMTIEQQKQDNKSAAVQYGGARPMQSEANGASGLALAGLFIGGMLLYIKMKGN